MQGYLINILCKLCKFYDSTVEIEYLITDTIIYFLSNLKIIYHNEDSSFHVDEFDNMLLNYIYLQRNCSPEISIARRDLL